MLDMHNHVLYGVDDGAENINTSIGMLKIAEGDGIDNIIATPHYCTGVYENYYENVANNVEELNKKAQECGLKVKILPGQEVTIDRHTINLIREGKIRGLNNSRYILVELPFDFMRDEIIEIIYELRILDLIPIIAHPERYKFINENILKVNAFINEGCLFQIDSGSISGLFGRKTKKTAVNLIRNNLCHFIASDAHSIGGRGPQLRSVLTKVCKIDRNMERKLSLNTELILNNCEPDFDVDKIESKKKYYFINFFRKFGWRVDKTNDRFDNFY